MKRSLLALALLVASASPALARWETQWVEHSVPVTVVPAPQIRYCDLGAPHYVQPPSYTEYRRQWTQRTVWVPDPIVYHEIYPNYNTPATYAVPSTFVAPSCPCTQSVYVPR